MSYAFSSSSHGQFSRFCPLFAVRPDIDAVRQCIYLFSSIQLQHRKTVGLLSLAVALALFWVAATHKIDLILPSTLAVGGVWCIYHRTTLVHAHSAAAHAPCA